MSATSPVLMGHDRQRRRGIRARVGLATLVTGVALGGGLLTAAPAQAATLDCGTPVIVNNQTGRATCTGYGDWQVVVQCYYWGANGSGFQYQNGGTQTRTATCPRTSYVTRVLIERR